MSVRTVRVMAIKARYENEGQGYMWVRTMRAGSGRPRLIRDRALKGQVHLLTLTWGPIISRQILEATVFGNRDVRLPQPLGHLLILAIDLRLSVLVYLVLSFGNSPVRELSFPTTFVPPPPPPHPIPVVLTYVWKRWPSEFMLLMLGGTVDLLEYCC